MDKKKKKKGGKRKGAGRKSIMSSVGNYQKNISILERLAPKALKALEDCLGSDNEMIKLRAASEILKKVIPDKKEISGVDGGPLEIKVVIEDSIGSINKVSPKTKGSVPVAGAV